MRGSPSSTDSDQGTAGAGWGVVIRRAPPTTGGLRRSGRAEETAGASGPHSMLRGSGGASPPPAPTSRMLVLASCAGLNGPWLPRLRGRGVGSCCEAPLEGRWLGRRNCAGGRVGTSEYAENVSIATPRRGAGGERATSQLHHWGAAHHRG